MPAIVAIFAVVAIASVLMTVIRLAAASIIANRPATYIGTAYSESRINDPAERTYDLADDAI